jgi:hypothetical protein
VSACVGVGGGAAVPVQTKASLEATIARHVATIASHVATIATRNDRIRDLEASLTAAQAQAAEAIEQHTVLKEGLQQVGMPVPTHLPTSPRTHATPHTASATHSSHTSPPPFPVGKSCKATVWVASSCVCDAER